MRRLLLHPKLVLATRILLGLIFLAAALPKIADPPGFAKAIWAYGLFPPWSINPLALLLPWLELVCGGRRRPPPTRCRYNRRCPESGAAR